MDQLRALKYFIAVADSGSFTQASKLFSVPASSLSRRVADLEQSLGATLLQRTTRVVKLTEVGQSYYQQVKELIASLEQSDESVRTYHSEPMGHLKISSMVGFGETILLPLMDEFSERYPKVVLDISLSDQLSSLNHDNVDIAIRGGYAPNERVVAINIMDNQFSPVASPSYLKEAGTPRHSLDLKNHKGLFFRTPNGPTPWLSQIENQWHNVSAPAVAISNNGAWLMKKAIQGDGIIMLPKWVTQPYVDRGELNAIHIDPPVTITQQENFAVFLLYQKQRYLVPKIKVAVDFLVARIKNQ